MMRKASYSVLAVLVWGLFLCGDPPKAQPAQAPRALSAREVRDREELTRLAVQGLPWDEICIRTILLRAVGRAFLIAEIEGLERLFLRTPRESPDRAALIRRLAEDYVELEGAAIRDKLVAELTVEDLARRKKPPSTLCSTVGQCRAESKKASKLATDARQRAIHYYTMLKDEYPNYSKLDAVLNYLACEYYQVPDSKMVLAVYAELLEKAPKSPYVPNAYLAFGELLFQEAQGDPKKWVSAREAYEKVLKHPAPDNKLWGYAAYKLGYVFWNTGDFGGALRRFKRVIEWADKYPKTHSAPRLANYARRDLIPLYMAGGAPRTPYNFFKPLSGDQGGEQTKTRGMMNELGVAYLASGHFKEGITLYKDLMVRDPGPKTCFYQSQITTAIQAIDSSNKNRVLEALDQQIRVRNDFVRKQYPEQDKLRCSNWTAELLVETATNWHREAAGSGGVRGTGDQKTIELAGLLYKKLCQTFTQEDFAKFEFPSEWSKRRPFH